MRRSIPFCDHLRSTLGSDRRARRGVLLELECVETRVLLSGDLPYPVDPEVPAPAPAAVVGASAVIAGQLRIASQPPAACVVNSLFSMVVAATDASGAVDTLYNGKVTIGLVQNPTSATLSGTLTVSAVHGLATFSMLSLNEVGKDYTIAATADGLTSVISSPIDIVPANAGPPLHIVSITPAPGNYPALPGGTVVVTFNQPLAGLVADVASGGGFTRSPFAVFLVPRGPSGVFAAPSSLNAGSTPIHATLVYHVNADKTSTITLTPRAPLGTDIYLITVSGTLASTAGNPLTDASGTTGPEYRTFELMTTPPNSLPLKVMSVTTDHASESITNGATIAQPDTIAIGFNKPVDYLMLNSSTVQLLAGQFGLPVSSVVAYSPATRTVYITPTQKLVAGIKYTVRISGTVTDDQGFPNPDTSYTLGANFTRSFFVAAGAPVISRPLVALSKDGHLLASPSYGPARTSPFGYASIPFSEPLDLAASGRYSVMLMPQMGGLDNSAPDSADTTLNARVAFNPNVDALIIVPTVPTGNDVYWYCLTNLRATNGDPLVNPGGTLPVRDSFALALPAQAASARSGIAAGDLASLFSEFEAGSVSAVIDGPALFRQGPHRQGWRRGLPPDA